ncbi:GNAT family N-acetyltransferase [Nocardioides donggukensis]|uniref:GNAT family N-acetyltransferase n=1 Tax=Nocardioides donggukensis TaxID=2774019 RepID=A0A927Q2X6_9ACTN|nr:GNAT family N-acetyltransferase [Nocardioides donggukensis]MBD8870809.1 GNAT family N-acetyltransferase [Nocardioides donggukensis]
MPDLSGVTLRPATVDDAEAGAALQRDCWREAYGPLVPAATLEPLLADAELWVAVWRRPVGADPPRTVAVAGGELVGFGVAGRARDEDAPSAEELRALYVRRRWWGSGLGALLLAAVVADRPCSLWVLESNLRARRFYASHGFVADGSRQVCEPLAAPEVRMVRGGISDPRRPPAGTG